MAFPDYTGIITRRERITFLERINRTETCWFWEGAHDGNGYGLCRALGKYDLVHRVIYKLYKGRIPDGFVIDHLCVDPRCCNPEHLEAVTPTENIRRRVKSSRGEVY